MSAMVAAFSSPFNGRASGTGHEPVPDEEQHDEENARPRSVEPSTVLTSGARRRPSSSSRIVDAHDEDDPEIALENLNNNDNNSIEEEDDLEAAPVMRLTDRMSLRELEEERELARRRTSVCLLLGVFLLFRLWIEALTQADFGLLMLCLVGTSWCARYIRHNREREEELDRRIAAYMENNDGENAEGRPDLRMLSFQAQLALAIMESQRQMMQGGFGHPDGQAANLGVSDEARQQWERFKFKTVEDSETCAIKKGQYGSVAQDEEEPSCTICLGEYEDGEELVKLPCEHIYHDECLTAWTAEHSKCPLCNLDLDTVATENSSQAPSQDD